jgi:hypothetical protein
MCQAQYPNSMYDGNLPSESADENDTSPPVPLHTTFLPLPAPSPLPCPPSFLSPFHQLLPTICEFVTNHGCPGVSECVCQEGFVEVEGQGCVPAGRGGATATAGAGTLTRMRACARAHTHTLTHARAHVHEQKRGMERY